MWKDLIPSFKEPEAIFCAAAIYNGPSWLITGINKAMVILRIAEKRRRKSKSRWVVDHFNWLNVFTATLIFCEFFSH
jgi:hypothetical protein